jgi:hypothetical protein
MMTLWTVCCAFLALIVELVIGGYGVVLPVFPVTVFYFTVVRGWRRTAVLFLVLGTVMDLACGRTVPVAVLAVPGVQAVAMFWRRHGDCRLRGAQAAPGFAVGALNGALLLVLLVLPGARWGEALAGEVATLLAEVALGAAVLLPLLCAGLDAAAEQMVFDSYRQVREGR